MRSIAKLMKDWQFTGPNGVTTAVELPHTWNARDGQDGGNDYWRGCCTYCTRFAAPVYDPAQQQVWLQFEGVNASAAVLLNGQQLYTHDGGYSTFRAEVTELLQAENQLTVQSGYQQTGYCAPADWRTVFIRTCGPGMMLWTILSTTPWKSCGRFQRCPGMSFSPSIL